MEWRDPEFTADGRINCHVDHPEYGWVPLTASPDDPETCGLFAAMQDSAAPFVPKPDDGAMLAAQARAYRNGLLSSSDWTQLADAPVDRMAWAAYRQSLRDVPGQASFPEVINWPTAPEGRA